MQNADLPKHIAIIMDGNRRWAKKRHLPVIMGHRAGIDSVRRTLKGCLKLNIPMLTIYAFSTENWSRPKREVDMLMGFMGEYIDKELGKLKTNGIKLNFIGRLKELPDSVRKKVERAMEVTQNNSKLSFNVALNYGARSEIVDAVKRVIDEKRHDINENNFSDFLYTRGLADPDLLIRTSGEHRLSNFLLWQLSYSELYFTKVLWPDFGRRHLIKAIEAYSKRNRRFGE